MAAAVSAATFTEAVVGTDVVIELFAADLGGVDRNLDEDSVLLFEVLLWETTDAENVVNNVGGGIATGICVTVGVTVTPVISPGAVDANTGCNDEERPTGVGSANTGGGIAVEFVPFGVRLATASIAWILAVAAAAATAAAVGIELANGADAGPSKQLGGVMARPTRKY